MKQVVPSTQESAQLITSFDDNSLQTSQENQELDYKQFASTYATAQKCIIRSSNSWRIKWDLVIILLALYNSISIPISVAFNFEEDNEGFIAWEYFVDVLFVLDIFVNFRCTFINADGEEIFDPQAIAKNYVISGRFFIDLFASIPFELIPLILNMEADKNLKLFQILKMIRLLRLRRIITYLKFQTDFKLWLKIFIIIFNLFLFVHIVGCFWHMIVMIDEEWHPPKDTGRETDFYDNDKNTLKYTISLYYATLMLLGADILPYDQAQTAYACIVLIIGAIVTAALFGHMTVLVQGLNKKTAKFHKKLDVANQAMNSIQLPNTIQNQVVEYITYTYNNRDHQQELNKFFDMISPSLKYKVTVHLYRKVLKKNPLLRGSPELIEFIIHRLETKLTQPEQKLMKIGEKGNCMYFIARGEVEVYTLDQSLNEQHHRQLKAGEFFGEIALLLGSRRSMSAISRNYCTLAKLEQQDFEDLIQKFPGAKQNLQKKLNDYDDSYHVNVFKFLKNIPYLFNLNEFELKLLAFLVKQQRIENSIKLVKRGQIPNNLIIVFGGQLQLVIDRPNNENIVYKNLFSGSAVFIYSIFQKIPIQHSLQGIGNSTILTLSSKTILEQAQQLAMLAQNLRKVEKRIQAEILPTYNDFIDPALVYSPSANFRYFVIRLMRGKQMQRHFTMSDRMGNLLNVIKEYVEINNSKQHDEEEDQYKQQLKSILQATNDLVAKIDILVNSHRTLPRNI